MKVRDLPQIITLADDDLLYVVDFSAGPNGGRKITKQDLKFSVAPTAAETKAAYESNPDTNAFTDAEKAKLATVESGAQFQEAFEVPYNNILSGLAATEVQSAITEVNTKAQADFRPSIVTGRILHYSGGTARFDDVFFAILAGDILLNTNITNGEVYVDLDGLVKQTASGVTAPPLTIVFAKFSTDLNDIISLTDERVKNTQNLVRGTISDVRDVRAGAAASAGNSGRLSDAMHKHNILTGAASTQTPDQANAEGASVNLARADHVHEIVTAAPLFALAPSTTNAQGSATSFSRSDHSHAISTALVGDITTIQPDATADAGVADTFARGDHRHAIVADAAASQTPDQANAEGVSTSFSRADHVHNLLTAAPTTALSPATANTQGVAASFARSDHIHAVATALVGDITTILPDDAASAGTANTFARGDHRHAIAAGSAIAQTPDQPNAEGASTSFSRADHVHNLLTAAPLTALSPATTNAQGSAASFSRSDHTHSIATGLVGDITTIDPDDGPSAGTVDRFARADHQHAIAAGSVISQTPDQANAEGSSSSFARADHVHNLLTAAPTTTLSPATANTQGVAASFARSDHIHAVATALVGDITTIQPDATASAGTANTFARGDHRHAIVADTAVTITTSGVNAEGASTSFARADHTHAVLVANQAATATADDTTASATDVLIAGMTLTPAAGTYLATFSSSVVNSGNGASRIFVSIYSAGAQVTHSERNIGISGAANTPVHTTAIVTVNGSQAIEAQWRAVGGTNTAHQRSLSIIRIG